MLVSTHYQAPVSCLVRQQFPTLLLAIGKEAQLQGSKFKKLQQCAAVKWLCSCAGAAALNSEASVMALLQLLSVFKSETAAALIHTFRCAGGQTAASKAWQEVTTPFFDGLHVTKCMPWHAVHCCVATAPGRSAGHKSAGADSCEAAQQVHGASGRGNASGSQDASGPKGNRAQADVHCHCCRQVPLQTSKCRTHIKVLIPLLGITQSGRATMAGPCFIHVTGASWDPCIKCPVLDKATVPNTIICQCLLPRRLCWLQLRPKASVPELNLQDAPSDALEDLLIIACNGVSAGPPLALLKMAAAQCQCLYKLPTTAAAEKEQSLLVFELLQTCATRAHSDVMRELLALPAAKMLGAYAGLVTKLESCAATAAGIGCTLHTTEVTGRLLVQAVLVQPRRL